MADAATTNASEWSVSELSGALKRTIEGAFGHVRLRGEVSGYRGPHSSGHCYFSLKDENARIEAVIWKTAFARMKFRPEDGLEVIATGRVSTFPGSSKYQIVIESLEPAGIGALMALLEERRRRLAAEGLFDEARKRPLPYLPRVVGVITSPTGAVIRDILHRLADRFPRRVLVWPVRVQGETSAAEVAAAILGFNALAPDGPMPPPDVLIVARGGGSFEDLFGFSDEAVVRAAAASAIPLISAIGHETDWTLLDHVADRRAPTPTGAAEMAVPVRAELIASLASLGGRLAASMLRLAERKRAELRSTARAMAGRDQLFAGARQRLDMAGRGLGRALILAARRKETVLSAQARRLQRVSPHVRLAEIRARFLSLRERLRPSALAAVTVRHRQVDNLTKLLSSVSYKRVLARGYALVHDATGVPLRRAADIARGQTLSLEFADGKMGAVAAGDTLPPAPPRRRRSRSAAREKEPSLFE